jgi:hypothetical protein
MSEQRDPVSTRTVVVTFPDGERQYWLTDQVFSSGDTVKRNGRAWVVTDVIDPVRSRGYLKVKLRDLSDRNGSLDAEAATLAPASELP